jgi:ubiquinone/menaquinone biosynthesis C-methylase UbiE
MSKQAKYIRSKLLEDYYTNIYNEFLFKKSTLASGISYFEKSIEKSWKKSEKKIHVLEIGGASGEHLHFMDLQNISKYEILDIRKPNRNVTKDLPTEMRKKVKFKVGNAEELTYKNNSFDRTFSTCLLHHVDDPFSVMWEARRVTKIGGQIGFILPTDPGVLNRFVKKLITYPRLKSLTTFNPKLMYALDHKNHVAALLEQAKFVFKNDDLEFIYKPFRLKTWNFNLLIIIIATKSRDVKDL